MPWHWQANEDIVADSAAAEHVMQRNHFSETTVDELSDPRVARASAAVGESGVSPNS